MREVSLTDARSPWCPGWRPRGWGSLPAGMGSLLAPLTGPCRPPYDLRVPGSCLPAGWGLLLAPYSFPFAVRVMPICRLYYWYNWVLPVLFPFCRKGYADLSLVLLIWLGLACTQISLPLPQGCISFSLLSLGVYRGVFLLPGYAYTQGISPLWKKKLKLTWNCPRSVQISHESP